jgi:hypothetical protein
LKKYAIKSPEVILFTICSFLTYWAGLYKAEDAEKIRGGVKKLITMAADLARKTQETVLVPEILMIEDRDRHAAQV